MNEQSPDSGNSQDAEPPEQEETARLHEAASKMTGQDSETVMVYYPRGDDEAPPAVSVEMNEHGEIRLEIDDHLAPDSILDDASPDLRSATIIDLARDELSAEQTADLTSYLEDVRESGAYRLETVLKGAPDPSE